tara:strand:+ start:3939 stop:5081 length:1143 start_codon:yes stop_codon:yes gene_type:complete
MSHFSKIKELTTLGSGEIFGSVLSAIFWFYLASQIEPSEYGEIHWILGIAGIFSYVALVGTLNTLTVFTAKNVQIQSTLYFISLIFSLVLSFVIIIFFPGFFLIDSGILLFAYVINTLALGDILGRKDYLGYSKYILIQKGLTLGIGLTFFYIFGYESIIFALALSYIVYSKRIITVFKTIKINFNLFKNNVKFIFDNYIIFLVYSLEEQIDKIIIMPLFGSVILGNFSLGVQAISVLLIFSMIFYKFILPQDSTGSDLKKLKIYVILISIGISLFGVISGPILIEEFFPKYVEIKGAIQIMSLDAIPATIVLILQSKFLGDQKSRIVLYGTILSVSILVVSMITLGTSNGIIGLAWSVIIATSSKALFFAYNYLKKPKI